MQSGNSEPAIRESPRRGLGPPGQQRPAHKVAKRIAFSLKPHSRVLGLSPGSVLRTRLTLHRLSLQHLANVSYAAVKSVWPLTAHSRLGPPLASKEPAATSAERWL